MEMYDHIDGLPDVPIEPVVTIGNFDGVHRGHQAILSRLREEGERLGAPTMVITFSPHPSQVLRPSVPFHGVMSLREKMRCLWELGIDHALVIRFDHEFTEMTASEFVEEVLWDALRVRAVHVGRDTRFGSGREGDIQFLSSEGRRLGFHVGIVEPVLVDGEVISSSRIRKAVLAGQLREASRLLGRAHRIVGVVEKGDQRGRTLGFPTANLTSDGAMLPPDGVYAAWSYLEDGKRHPSVVNIGVRPTFDVEPRRVVEVHLLDFSADLYGQRLQVGLMERIRGEAKFEGVAELKAQIQRDVVAARRLLGL